MQISLIDLRNSNVIVLVCNILVKG